ncbi:Spx/MgsR family RNA polymerase-binding regulatory protein [Lentilactobacillus sp. Marseille-Q4993]|uniref:Spx/MgsR family RNA polymerase-binding regulatory protein n=1 Tax=Lentilactobacillus sp. Marseille-Q4993 TaxID=3039492 RepID=UPI0024BC864B|nr:Spx/MgsR family RNA polymerase-binding regulatory protein [Lentilactobacillus sp. Marseille-Q4993]
MLNLYVSPSSSSSRKAKQWLRDHGIAFKERNIGREPLNAEEIKQLMALTEDGSDELISTRAKIYTRVKDNLDNLTLSELIDLLVEHQELIKRPIIFNDYQMQIGFSEEEIRLFLPREVRQENLRRLTANIS